MSSCTSGAFCGAVPSAFLCARVWGYDASGHGCFELGSRVVLRFAGQVFGLSGRPCFQRNSGTPPGGSVQYRTLHSSLRSTRGARAALSFGPCTLAQLGLLGLV